MSEVGSVDTRQPLLSQWLQQIEIVSGSSLPDGERPRRMEEVDDWGKSGKIAEDHLARALARTLNVPWLNSLSNSSVSSEFIQRIPIHFARRHGMIALADDGGQLPVIFAGWDGWCQLDNLRRCLRCDVAPRMASSDTVMAAINLAYQQRTGQTEQLIESFVETPEMDRLRAQALREDLLDVSGRAPVIQLVNLILFDAVKTRASDVHIQPYGNRVVVRFRIDGVLFDQFTVPKITQDEMVSRVKVLGRMNIAEKRLPQDGRATVQVGDRQIDLRIASLPTSDGERVVIRLLDKSARLYSLGELGMTDEMLRGFREIIEQEHGLMLVTGPTGAGKSTTLYAALQQINAKDLNILTLEDPIEYQLEGISQTQVSAKKGMTFASGLRNVLRQDPDIVMVGEIRDHETAEMAIQSALTGHMVFSTLHTNDAASAVTRLLDLGIEPYLVASSLVGVLAQRLVRRICATCRSPLGSAQHEDFMSRGATDEELPHYAKYFLGAGCEDCRQTGYQGRLGIFELMVIGSEIRELIQRRANASEIRRAAVKDGMRLLRDDGVRQVLAGETSVEEVIRVSAKMSGSEA